MTPFSEPHLEIFNESGIEIPLDRRLARKCMLEVSRQEASSFNMLEIVYVDEPTIRKINRKHLDHDYITDIITFRYDDKGSKIDIEATLYCCAPKIKEQALEYNESIDSEFVRVLVHGMLHLVGYDDHSPEEQLKIREREDFYLDLVLG